MTTWKRREYTFVQGTRSRKSSRKLLREQFCLKTDEQLRYNEENDVLRQNEMTSEFFLTN